MTLIEANSLKGCSDGGETGGLAIVYKNIFQRSLVAEMRRDGVLSALAWK